MAKLRTGTIIYLNLGYLTVSYQTIIWSNSKLYKHLGENIITNSNILHGVIITLIDETIHPN